MAQIGTITVLYGVTSLSLAVPVSVVVKHVLLVEIQHQDPRH